MGEVVTSWPGSRGPPRQYDKPGGPDSLTGWRELNTWPPAAGKASRIVAAFCAIPRSQREKARDTRAVREEVLRRFG